MSALPPGSNLTSSEDKVSISGVRASELGCGSILAGMSHLLEENHARNNTSTRR